MAIIDIVGQILWFTGLPVGIVASVIVASKWSVANTKVVAATSTLFSLLAFFYLTSLSILSRDGMAPGLIVSTGMESVIRTLPGFIAATLVGLALSIPGLVAFIRRERKNA